MVQEAWADLQQLPTPWNGDGDKRKVTSGTIEFGALDDDGETAQPPASVPAAVEDFPVAEMSEPLTIDTVIEKPEPARHVRQIEQLVGELNDEFRPAGTIRPEVELEFDDPTGPFREPFEEEELVIDRCAASLADRNAQAISERVPSIESRRPDRPGPDTVPLLPEVTLVDLDLEEPEVVVEDDYDFVERQPLHPVTPVRRHEYRQLFARLRRA